MIGNKGKVEKVVLKDVLGALNLWERRGIVVHYDRINSGSVHIGKTHMRLAKAGTPDVFAFCDFGGPIVVLFIEVKRERGGKWSDKQKLFADKFKDFPNVFYIVCRSAQEIHDLMEMNSGYTVSKLKEMDDFLTKGV